tara:strand:+ start:673 stop:1470 length:798 start_codon:yes stop_codon:yes gene_type:complete
MGNIQWEQTLGDLNFVNNEFKSHWLGVEEMPNGEYLSFGTQTVWNVQKSWLVKLSNTGNILKDTLYNFSGTLTNYFNAEGNIEFTPNGAYIVGHYQDISNVLAHSYLVYINYDLEVQWFRHFEQRTYNDLITYIKPHPPNPEYLFMGGFTSSDDVSNTNDEWFIVVDSLGCDVFGCSVGFEENIKEEVYFKVYPNPSTGIVTFTTNKNNIGGDLSVYNIVGEQILSEQIIDNKIEKDLSRLPKGIYLILVTNKFGQSDYKKLVLK